jgi:hypothetical protein
MEKSIPDGLEKPTLKREIKMNTDPLPELRNANFSIIENNCPDAKMVVAYDIAGNAIEASVNEILEQKHRPTPDFKIITQDEDKIDLGFSVSKAPPSKTRSGKLYSA